MRNLKCSDISPARFLVAYKHGWLVAVTMVVLIGTANGQATGVNLQGALSGNWYDPSRSGEGMMFDISQQDGKNILFVAWFTHDEGKQRWLAGNIEFAAGAKQLTLPLYVFEGAQFDNAFDGAQVQRKDWGSITISFPSCSAMQFSYTAGTLTGQGRLQRLLGGLKNVPCR